MPPLPTRKTSKSRSRKRSSHLRLRISTIGPCPRCHNAKLPHHVCPTCGYYNGRDILEKEVTGGSQRGSPPA